MRLAAVNHHEVGQRVAFVELASVTSEHGLLHRGRVVRALDRLDLELAVLLPVHPSVLADDQRGDVLRARNVRHVKRLDARREARQFKNLLQLFEHALHVGLQDAEALLERDLRVLLNEFYHLALLPALRVEYSHAPAFALRQGLLQQPAVFKVRRHVNLARHVVGRVVLREHVTQKRRRVERVVRGQVFPEELAASDDLPLAHSEELKGEARPLAVEAEDVNVEVLCDGHLLLL